MFYHCYGLELPALVSLLFLNALQVIFPVIACTQGSTPRSRVIGTPSTFLKKSFLLQKVKIVHIYWMSAVVRALYVLNRLILSTSLYWWLLSFPLCRWECQCTRKLRYYMWKHSVHCRWSMNITKVGSHNSDDFMCLNTTTDQKYQREKEGRCLWGC